MNYLEEKIKREGIVRPGNILKIDHFLNHQIDIELMRQMAWDMKYRFEGFEVTKVLTIEASGIAIATMMGHLYDVPMVFARKSETVVTPDDKYISEAFSFTHKQKNKVYVSKEYLASTDKVLIVDDFLADGEATHALIDIVKQAGAEVVGIGVAVEKGNQKGGRMLRDEGYKVEAIAVIEAMDYESQTISFREDEEPGNRPTVITEQDKEFMREAIRLADESVKHGGGPFGAIIVKDGKVIAGRSNSVTIDNDPTAHAEVNTIREACRRLGTFDLSGCTIYTSCEPCPMCLGSIYWARINRIFYGNTRKDAREINFADDFIYEELERPLYARTVPIVPLLRDEALSSFRLWQKKTDKTEY